jgi:hypothetical protein
MRTELNSNIHRNQRRGYDAFLLVLASLTEGDKHRYAIMEDVERFAGDCLGRGTLFGAIARSPRMDAATWKNNSRA